MQYLTPQQVYKQYGFHPKTLADWADAGKVEFIRSPGGHRRYSQQSIENIKTGSDNRDIILYARVSTSQQKPELENQIKYLGLNFPNTQCVYEIGSGMNFKRKKFISLMESVAKNEVKEIVIAHKDRLIRFGFEFIEWFCSLHNCQITVLNNTNSSPQAELMQDFVSIVHCFSSRLYFLRKYEKQILKYIDKTE
ncbi:resolvase domain protein [Calothrix sp. NIES-4071]|nr:resolvase domain protein [Calothrix sp. NIES-4071]BAZ60173.1 resolvase domain protein [Calothrix sp. NIES-4105]